MAELCYRADLIYLSLFFSGQTNHWKDEESRSQRDLSANTTRVIADSGSICVPGDAALNVLQTPFSFPEIKTLQANQSSLAQNS